MALVTTTTGTDSFTGTGGLGNTTSGDDIIEILSNTLTAGDVINGGSGTDVIHLMFAGTAYDFTVISSLSSIEQISILIGSGNETVSFTAQQYMQPMTIDLGAGATDTINVQLSAGNSDFSAATAPTISNVERVNLSGTGSGDTAAFTGVALNAFTSIDFGAGTDTLDLRSTSTGLNALSDANLAGIERITAASAASGVVINLANQTEGFTAIIGSAFADTVTGGSGNDTIDGGAGNDIISAGAGSDTITGGAGNDTIDGGIGSDTAVYSGAWVNYTITGSGTLTITDTRGASPDGTDTVSNVENFQFSNGTFTAADIINDAPTDISLSAASILENASAGTVVGSLSSLDADAPLGDTATYSLTDSAGGRFAISGSNVVVANATLLDRETAASHQVTIRITDAKGLTFDKTFTISVGDVNEFAVTTPADTDVAVNQIAENTTGLVGITAQAFDGDATINAVTYALVTSGGGAYSGPFAIDSTTGVVSLTSPLDRETTGPSVALYVKATSADGSTATQSFTVAIADVNEFAVTTPADTDGASGGAINENTTGLVGITAFASDADATTNAVTYALVTSGGGAYSGPFAIDSTTGVVSLTSALDREATGPSVTLYVKATSPDGSTATQSFTVAIADVNEFAVTTPADTDGASGGAINENTTGLVGITAFASDADATTNAVTYALVTSGGGAYSGPFAIDSTTGVVSLTSALDREATGPSVTLYVKATSPDGSTATQSFTVAIADVNEFAVTTPADTDVAVNQIAENTTGLVGITTFASDADATTNAVTYALVTSGGGVYSGPFAIDSTTGVVSLTSALDREATGPSVTLYVKATSPDGSTATQSFTVAIADVNEFAVTTPADTDVAVNQIAENTTGLVGITAFASDADATTNAVTYALVTSGGGAYSGPFAIDSTTGVVSLTSALDREATGPSVTLYVKATSPDGSTATQSFTVAIADINEFAVTTPADTDVAVNQIAENTTGLVGITTFASDADATTNAVTYALVTSGGGVYSGPFAIDSTTGVVSLTSALDREATGPSVTLYVKATSADGSSAVQAFAVAVTDVNDAAPVITTSAYVSVAEGQVIVAALTSTDQDTVGTNPATFTITGGADASLFDIVAGNLVFKSAHDYETQAHSYDVIVTADDGANQTSKTITVALTDVNDAAPVITTSANVSVAEGQVIVAALTSTDQDTVGTNPATFTITGGADASLFDIVAGNLVFKSAHDYETQAHSYDVIVTADDGANQTSKTITVALTDVNDAAPVITTSTLQTVVEGQTFVAALAATDLDDLGGPSSAVFSITGGADANLFDIAGGNLVFVGARDYETDAHSYQVVVSASDGTNATSELITVTLTDLNDTAPTITTNGTLAVAEGQTIVATLASTDPDTIGLNPAIFTITGGADAALFDLIGGTLVFKNAHDYETDPHSYEVIVTAGDGLNQTSKTITIALTDVNDVAPMITTSANITVAEGQVIVAALTSTDLDTIGTNPATFTITGGADASLFDIVAGNLVFKTARDYETDPHSYEVIVTANDGINQTNKTITVALADVAAAPTDILLSNAAINEFAANGTFVANLSAADVSNTTGLTFTIVNDNNAGGRFAITGTQLVVANGLLLDYEQAAQHQVEIRVTDVGGVSYTKFVTIAVADVNPEFIIGDNTDNTFVGGYGNDIFFGNGGDDTLVGAGGNDTLDGGTGNDLLDGGTGNDTMTGGAGDDTYIVDSASDITTETLGGAAGGIDTVKSSITRVLGANLENLILTGAAAINATGNELANLLNGETNSAANILTGLAGNDTYIVGAGDKIVEAVNGGIDTVASSTINLNLASFTNVENITLLGTDALSAIGNLRPNVLDGSQNTAANTLTGLNGNDTYIVGDGDRIVEIATGGIDTVQSSMISLDLKNYANVENATLLGNSNLNLTGNTSNNVLTGNSGNNILSSGGGADRMAGGAGDDTYITDGSDNIIEAANEGTDHVMSSISYSLPANIENLTLTGRAALYGNGNTLDNVIVGNSGSNVINGRAGNDTLTGGAGNDFFVFNTGLNATTNVDTITDFNPIDDTIQLENAVFTKLTATGTLAAAMFRIGTAALDSNDYIVYNKATGDIFYDADGNGARTAIKFAHVDPLTDLTAADFMII